jgi:hypothetical protein
MSYAYAESVVWIEDLAAEAHPMVHDLCRSHAATVRVPRGWELREDWAGSAEPGGGDRLDLVGA